MDQDTEKQLIQKYYQQAVAGARSDEQELEIAHRLLEGALKGEVPGDDGVSLLTLTDGAGLPVDADFLIEDEAPQQRLRRSLPVAAVAIAGLILVLLVYGGGQGPAATPTPGVTSTPIVLATQTLTPVPQPRSTRSLPTSLPTDTPRPTETPTLAPTPLPTLTATPETPKEVLVKPEPVELAVGAVIPVSVEIAGRYFPVVPTTLRDDPSLHSGQVVWAYVPEPDRVSWLAGSQVNVVLGLPYDAANRDLLGVTVGLSDTLTLRDSVGGAWRYQVVERRQVSVYETEVLGQQRVGLTLVLLGGNEEAPGGGPDTRLVIRARPGDGEEVATPENQP